MPDMTNLIQINAKAAWINSRQIFEGGTCPTPQTRTVEWDMDRYVQRNNIYALWARARWSYWNNIECEAIHVLSMNLHLCSRLMKDMADLKDSLSVDITSHKEEMASQIKYDENDDRKVIREKLKTCIDPLNTAGQAATLVNIVCGRKGPNEVNVHDTVDLGKA